MKTRRKMNKNVTRRIYISLLKRLYPVCKHDSVDSSLYQNDKITYGEMDYEGMQQLYNHVKKINSKIDCFIDIGSGRGKLCMYMGSQPKINSVLGVELVKERHDDAVELKTDLRSVNLNKVELINKSILDVDLKKYSSNHVLVWFSNLCFNPSTKNDIFKKLVIELPKGTIVCCSNRPDINIEFLEIINIPMSWNHSSSVYIYRL